MAALKIDRILQALSPEDRAAVVFHAYRTYGGPISASAEESTREVEAFKENNRDRQRRFRERHSNVTRNVTSNVTPNVTDDENNVTLSRYSNGTPPISSSSLVLFKEEPVSKKPVIPPGFQKFWAAYPKRVARGEALRAWSKGNLELIADDILVGLHRTLFWINREGGKYRMNPATWLNAQGWEDDPPQPTHVLMNQDTAEAVRQFVEGPRDQSGPKELRD